MGFFSNFLRQLGGRYLRQLVEKYGAAWLVDKHWPTIVKGLDENGFLEADGTYRAEDIMAAAHLACERFIEHVI